MRPLPAGAREAHAARESPHRKAIEVTQPAILALEDGTVFEGVSVGASGLSVGEVVFNTALTGYQEVLTDPSYARQMVTLTYPHIGNTGFTPEDDEAAKVWCAGLIVRDVPRRPSNWRSREALPEWLTKRGVVAIAGIDTRKLTRLLRERGAQNGALMAGEIDADKAIEAARKFPGLKNLDLAQVVTTDRVHEWTEGSLDLDRGGFAKADGRFHVVAYDFGVKTNILRLLADRGCRLTVVPAKTPAADVLAMKPDGVFLSNGPGDPAATGAYAVPMIQGVLAKDLPIFGICLGHQMLALALGAKTVKMNHGHHGANHPVKDLTTGKVEITSMNHGFTVDSQTLPKGVSETHVSLFDGSNCGIAVDGKPVYSVQYHPEASPGPQDSFYLFERFAEAMKARRAA
jgi:carbamoyl-phosphate synthase small subunit